MDRCHFRIWPTDENRTGVAYPNYLELGLKHGLSFPGGLNSGQQVQYILDSAALPYSNIKSFDDLPIPFRCVATEMNNGTAHVFDNGSLAVALRSTMSLPGIFEPVTTPDGKVYVDGGLLDNLPVDVVKKMGADVVIADLPQDGSFQRKGTAVDVQRCWATRSR